MPLFKFQHTEEAFKEQGLPFHDLEILQSVSCASTLSSEVSKLDRYLISFLAGVKNVNKMGRRFTQSHDE